VDFGENEVDVDGIPDSKTQKITKEKKKFDTQPYSSGQIEERQKLINYILNEGYDKRNYPTNMTVQVGVSLLKIDVDERKNTLETDVWIRTMWKDSRLAWDVSEFNVGVLRINPNQVWIPDTTLYNSANLGEMMKCWESNVLIYPTGDVLWVPPCRLSTHCNFKLNTDPYGPQNCTLKFGSWTFDGLSQDLQIYNNETKADVSDLWDTTQWDLVSNEATRAERFYDCCTEPYVSITYNLTVQRKPTPKSNVSCNL